MTDIPDWKKAIDRGTSMHTILAEKKSAEGPDWMKTPEEEEMQWEVRKFAVETYGKTKWAQTESKQQMESISSVLDQEPMKSIPSVVLIQFEPILFFHMFQLQISGLPTAFLLLPESSSNQDLLQIFFLQEWYAWMSHGLLLFSSQGCQS